MASCVEFYTSGSGLSSTTSIRLVNPQPASFASCTYVLPSGAEISNSPFSISLADAQLLGYAILALWAIAWGFRALISSLRGSDRGEEQD